MRVSLICLLAGCATPQNLAHRAPRGNNVSTERAARQEVDETRALIGSGDTSAVIPRLLGIIAKYPETAAALEARYLLGMAYYKIGGYRDAIDLLNEYLRLAPNGPFARDAAEQIAKLTKEYDAKFVSPEELDEQIREMSAKVMAEPQNDEYQLRLADLLWKRGDYGKAGKIYAALVSRNRQYAADRVIASRIEFLPNGEYVVLSPQEVERRAIEVQPLAVINTASFRSGQDLFTREARFYSVTGQVVNRGDSVLYGVQVDVTIYGFGNIVYDTTTVSIGRLNPGEIRAFSVRFSNFENIENINRYECVATFQR